MILENLLVVIKDVTNITPQAYQTNIVGKPAITYSFYRTSDNGAVVQWRLQVRIFARTQLEAIQLEETICNSLVTIGDETKWGCSISSNGGGSLLDVETNTPQILIYFDITARS